MQQPEQRASGNFKAMAVPRLPRPTGGLKQAENRCRERAGAASRKRLGLLCYPLTYAEQCIPARK
jgi:hypothetical protein